MLQSPQNRGAAVGWYLYIARAKRDEKTVKETHIKLVRDLRIKNWGTLGFCWGWCWDEIRWDAMLGMESNGGCLALLRRPSSSLRPDRCKCCCLEDARLSGAMRGLAESNHVGDPGLAWSLCLSYSASFWKL